jgi:outer membrane protein assembly factor BamE (lipoprotein component of BamABCDE complex)
MNFLKKRWYYLIPVLLVCFPVLMVLYVSVTYDYGLNESWTYIQNMDKTDTKFRVGKYSESRFNKIDPGMMGSDVFELIGLPLERNMPDDTRWSYSVAQHGAKYFHERVVLMERGKVTGTIKRFHVPDMK